MSGRWEGPGVYVLHFERLVYGSAQHYTGQTHDIGGRLALHRATWAGEPRGSGVRFLRSAGRRDVDFRLGDFHPEMDRGARMRLEREVKRFASSHCRYCSPEVPCPELADSV